MPGETGITPRIGIGQAKRYGKSRRIGRSLGVIFQHGRKLHAPVVVEFHLEARGLGGQQRQSAFGQGELHLRRHGIHDAHDGLSGLHPFVIIDVFAFDDAGERRPELGLLEHIEGVVISRAGLRIAGSGSFEFLLRDGFVLQQPLHALQLRAGLFVCGAVGGDLQLDVAGSSSASSAPFFTFSPCDTGTSSTCPESLNARFTASSGVAMPAKSLSMTPAPDAVTTFTGRTVSGAG